MITPFQLHLDEKTGNTTVLIGSSKMGKTTLLMEIFKDNYNTKNYITTLFAWNHHIALYGKNPKLLKFPADLECSNEKMVSYIAIEKSINTKTNNKYNFVNFFDDVIDVRYNKMVNNSLLTLRNSNISTVVSLQYSNLLSKMARSNVNNVILFGLNTDEAIDCAVKTFLKSIFKEKFGLRPAEMVNFYKTLTADHRFIYLRPAENTISFHKISV
jgi:hypothetical protein